MLRLFCERTRNAKYLIYTVHSSVVLLSSMAGRAFKVPVPLSYNNVTEAKLVQKGSDVWVQLPTNLVQDRRMSGRSVYMTDYNKGLKGPPRLGNVKAKVVTRRRITPRPVEDFSMPQHRTKDCMDVSTHFDGFCSDRKRMSRSLSRSFEGMNSRSRYASMKSRHDEPISALLPVMGDAKAPELSMDHHYSSPSMITGRMPTAKSYNDKAREALPGLGKWSDTHNTHDINTVIPTDCSTAIDGDDFLENPFSRPDMVSYDHKRSVAIRTPQRSHSSTHALGNRLDEGQTLLDNADHTINLDPPTFENSAKRHELEILTKVNQGPHHLDSTISLDHLYQPSDYNTKAGYTVVSNTYEHGNATFSTTGSDNKGSFNISPDWVSERKKSVVIRH